MIGIKRKDFDKIINFARASVKEYSGAEIGGMAILEKDDNKDWIIKHPVILKQEVTSATCTLDKVELANYYTKSIMKHGKDIKFLWWHSHGDGSVFWSGTDEEAIKEYKGGNWSVSLVVNTDAEYVLRLDYWNPIHSKLDELELEFIDEKEYKIPTSIINQVKKNVSERKSEYSYKKWKSKQMSLSNYSSYFNGIDDEYLKNGFVGNDYGFTGDINRLPFHIKNEVKKVNSTFLDFNNKKAKYSLLNNQVNKLNYSASMYGKFR